MHQGAGLGAFVEGLDLFLHETNSVEPPLDGLPPLRFVLPLPILEFDLSRGHVYLMLAPLLLTARGRLPHCPDRSLGLHELLPE
eukprot:8803373-Alexandrium_andersonii.AAC.1